MTITSTAILWADADQTLPIYMLDVDTNGVYPGNDGYISTPLAVTGYTLEFIVRRTDPQESAILSKTTVSGISIGNGNGTNDLVTVTIADTDIAASPGRNYKGALWRTDSGSANPLWEGPVQIKRAARHS